MRKTTKITISLMFSITVILSATSICLASDNVKEAPNIKIIVEGEMATFNDEPIIMNGRTLLPLRAILTSLGVKNDNEHIAWNDSDRSITVNKDSQKIYLKIGSNTAYINDKATTLDVAPIIYNKNGRTYIPVRFVAQSLGKKVLWDSFTKWIYIRDEVEFNKVKQILDNSIKMTDSCDKIKINNIFKCKYETVKLNDESTYETSSSVMLDRKNKFMHELLETKDENEESPTKVDSYLINNLNYVSQSNVNSGAWKKQSLSDKEFIKLFNKNDASTIINQNDLVYAGLTIEEDIKNNQIILRGNTLPVSEEEKNPEGKDSVEEVSSFCEIYINKSSNYIEKINITARVSYVEHNMINSSDAKCSWIYSDYNGDFKVELPDDAKNSI